MQQLHELADCLLAIEVELRGLGWWSAAAPSPAALQSAQPFCVDTLTFEEWLQWVFLPRMQQIIENQAALPQQSAIAEMAEVVYAEQLGKTAALCQQIKRFDQLIMQQAGCKQGSAVLN